MLPVGKVKMLKNDYLFLNILIVWFNLITFFDMHAVQRRSSY